MGIYVSKLLIKAVQDGRIDENNPSHAMTYLDWKCDNCGEHTGYAQFISSGKKCRKCGEQEVTTPLD